MTAEVKKKDQQKAMSEELKVLKKNKQLMKMMVKATSKEKENNNIHNILTKKTLELRT